MYIRFSMFYIVFIHLRLYIKVVYKVDSKLQYPSCASVLRKACNRGVGVVVVIHLG